MSDDKKLINLNFGAPEPAPGDDPYFEPYDWKKDPLLEGRDAPPGEKNASPDVRMYVKCRCGALVPISLVGGLATACTICKRRYSFTAIPTKPVRGTYELEKKP